VSRSQWAEPEGIIHAWLGDKGRILNEKEKDMNQRVNLPATGKKSKIEVRHQKAKDG